MPMLRIHIIIFLLLIALRFQAQQFNYYTLSADNKLPSSEVYTILQDKKGFMWFATDRGVSRFNGTHLTNYTTANGLADNTVLRMCEDRKGRIWFASLSGEICYWENDTIRKTPASDIVRKCTTSHGIIISIYADSADNIWITSNNQVMFFSMNNPTRIHHLKAPPSDPDVHSVVNLICLGEKNAAFISSSYDPFVFLLPDINKPVFFKGVLNCGRYATKLDVHHYNFPIKEMNYPINKVSWAVSKNETYYYSINNILFRIEKNKPVTFKKLDDIILKIYTDAKNGLWIGFKGKGACYFKDSNWEQQPIRLYDKVSVDDFCMDHEGGVWVATLEKGVFYIPSTSILTFSNIPYLNDDITFIGHAYNQVFFVTYDNKVGKGEDLTITQDSLLTDLAEKNAGLFYMKTIGDTTYLSFSHQLIRHSKDNKYTLSLSLNNNLRSGKRIVKDGTGKIWIVNNGGLGPINNLQNQATMFRSPYRIGSVIPYGNDLLVGGKKGLALFKDYRFIDLNHLSPFLNGQITDMKTDSNGFVWIATIGNGVLRLKGKTVDQLTEKNGLISTICHKIAIDKQNNVWVGTNQGISYITNNKSFPIKNISEKNGLSSNEITQLSVENNHLWVGTKRGLNLLDIDEVTRPINTSPAYLESITVNNNKIGPFENRFDYNQNNFKFSLLGLTFKDKGNHRYRYRLVNLDTAWQETESNELLFNNLAPGKYTLQFKVANIDKIWSKQSFSYSFVINKPFWLTWWFILLEIVALIGIVYLIILWRINIIKRKEEEKLRINKLLAEYQMKALTAQMNPHFIFNAINSIQNFIIQNHSTLAYDYLIKFSKLIRLVLNNSKNNEITLQQELDTLGLYIELEQLRFKESFDYKLKVSKEIDTESLMIPALLLQPYIENAIWHGLMPLKDRKGRIQLTIEKNNELLNITIADNGVGRKASDQIKKKIVHKSHQSVGMELTGKRIELFGQESEFSIQIIDNYDDNNNATGTTVEIILPMIEMY